MKPKTYLPLLDYIRGASVLSVFIFHAMDTGFKAKELPWNGWIRSLEVSSWFLWCSPISYGQFAVSVFFVLSGFCIHLAHKSSTDQSFRSYFIRRFFRIYPAYLVALLIFSFCYPWGFVDLDKPSGERQLITHLLLFHNYFGDQTYYGINPSFWTISIEFQLYLLYPLVLWFAKRWGWRRALLITGAFEFGIRLVDAVHAVSFPGNHLPRWFTGSPFGFWFSWSIGAALAAGYMEGRILPFSQQPVRLWLPVAIASYLYLPLASFTFMLFAILTAVVMARILHGGRFGHRVSTNPWARALAFLGTVSYGFYLVHQPTIRLVRTAFDDLGMPPPEYPDEIFLACLTLFPFLLVAAWLCYLLVEKPAIQWGKALAKMGKGRASRAFRQPELPPEEKRAAGDAPSVTRMRPLNET